MPDQKIPEQEPGRKHSFIREKVVRPPMSRGQIVRRVAVYLLIAVMAGAAAGAGFAVARPLAERYLAPEETEESIPITLPIEEPTARCASRTRRRAWPWWRWTNRCCPIRQGTIPRP